VKYLKVVRAPKYLSSNAKEDRKEEGSSQKEEVEGYDAPPMGPHGPSPLFLTMDH